MKKRSNYSLFHPRYGLTWLAAGILYLLVKFPYRQQLMIGRFLGRLAFYLGKSRRRIADINLKLCFPALTWNDRKRLLKKHFESLGISVMETGMALWMPEKKLRSLFHFEGVEHFQAALSQKRGVLILSGHFTFLDIAARCTGYNFPVYAVYREQKNQVVDRLLKKIRDYSLLRIIHRHDIRQVIKVLKQGHAVWYAADQDYGIKHSVFAPFFGVAAATITMPSRYAELTQASVMTLFGYRLDDAQGYKITFSPCLANYPSGDHRQDATLYNQWLESAILKKPEQYFWVHRRFKTRPPEELSFYRK